MNWLQNSTLAIVIVGTLFACKTGNEISGEVNPSEKLGAFYVDTFSLKTSIVNFDSIPTNASYRILVGKHTDPKFGTVTANAFVQFWLNRSFLSSSFGPNPEVDSLSLRFFVSYGGSQSEYLYGTNKKVKINIYRLSSKISSDSTYFRQKSLALGDFYASKEIDLSTLNLTTTSFVHVNVTTLLGKEFIDNQSDFASNSTFQDRFYGLALLSDPSEESIIGIYDVSLIMYYHNYFGLNNIWVQNITRMDGNFGTKNGNNPFSAQNQILIDRSGSQIASLSEQQNATVSTELTNNYCYVQPNTGVFTKVELNSLESFKSKVIAENGSKTKILVTKAELVINPDVSDTLVYKLPERLYALEMDSNNKVKRITNVGGLQRLQDERGGIFGYTNTLFSFYDKSSNSYKFTVTTYIQAILDGTKSNKGLLLGSANEGNVYGTLDRLIFLNDLSLGGTKGVKLKIYYTPYK